MRPRLALLGWRAASAAAIARLSSAASTLPGPPVAGGDALRRWAEAGGGATAVLGIVRLLGLALAWYVLGSTTLALVARGAGWVWAISVTHAIALPAVRRLVESALAVTLTVGVASPAVASAAPIAQVTDAEPGSGPDAEPAAEAETATLRRLDPAPPPATAPPAAPAPPAPSPRTHVVQPGDHLWSIAERTVTADLGRPATDGETAAYWRALIDRNAGSFAGGDPDLIFPGQTLALPPPPA